MCSVPTARPNPDLLLGLSGPYVPLKPAPPEPALFVRFRGAGRLPLPILPSMPASPGRAVCRAAAPPYSSRAACRAAGAVSLRSTPPFTPFASLTSVPVPPLTMPRVARAPAIPPPPPLPALSLVLTGQVYLVSVKKGRLLTPRPPLVNKMGLFCLPKSSLTTDCPGSGAPIWIVPHLKPPTIHTGTCFPGQSSS